MRCPRCQVEMRYIGTTKESSKILGKSTYDYIHRCYNEDCSVLELRYTIKFKKD